MGERYHGDDIVNALKNTPFSERQATAANSQCPGSQVPVSRKSSKLCRAVDQRSVQEIAEAIEARCADQSSLLEFLRAVCQGINILRSQRKKCEVIRKCVSIISRGGMTPSVAQACLQFINSDLPSLSVDSRKLERLLDRTIEASMLPSSRGLPLHLVPGLLQLLNQVYLEQSDDDEDVVEGRGGGGGGQEGREESVGAGAAGASTAAAAATAQVTGDAIARRMLSMDWNSVCSTNFLVVLRELQLEDDEITTAVVQKVLHEVALVASSSELPSLVNQLITLVTSSSPSSRTRSALILGLCTLFEFFDDQLEKKENAQQQQQQQQNEEEDSDKEEEEKKSDGSDALKDASGSGSNNHSSSSNVGGKGTPVYASYSRDSLSLITGTVVIQISFALMQDRHLHSVLSKLKAQLVWRPLGVAMLQCCRVKTLEASVKLAIVSQCRTTQRVDQLDGILGEYASLGRGARAVLGRSHTPWIAQLLVAESQWLGEPVATNIFEPNNSSANGQTSNNVFWPVVVPGVAPPLRGSMARPDSSSFSSPSPSPPPDYLLQMYDACVLAGGPAHALAQCVWRARGGWDHLISSLVAVGIALLDAGALAHDRSSMRGGQTSNQSHHLGDRGVAAMGLFVLVTLFVRHPGVRDEIVSLLVARAVTSAKSVAVDACRILAAAVAYRPVLFTGRRLAHLQEVCGSLNSLPARASGFLVSACVPLLASQSRLVDTVALSLRKGAWDRALAVRWNAAQGLSLLLHWIEGAPRQGPLAAGDNNDGGVVAVVVDQRRRVDAAPSVQTDDLVNLLARYLDQQLSLRLAFYQTAVSVCLATRRMSTIDLFARLLDNQLTKYMCTEYKSKTTTTTTITTTTAAAAGGVVDQSCSLLDLGRCFDDSRLEPLGSPYQKLPLLLEPLPELVDCASQCVAAAYRLATAINSTSSHAGDNGNTVSMDAVPSSVRSLVDKLEWLVEQACESDAGQWWGLRNCIWGSVTKEGRQTRRSAAIALTLLEKLCDYTLMGSEPCYPIPRPLQLSVRMVDQLLNRWQQLSTHLRERGAAVLSDQPQDLYAWDNSILAVGEAVTRIKGTVKSGGVSGSSIAADAGDRAAALISGTQPPSVAATTAGGGGGGGKKRGSENANNDINHSAQLLAFGPLLSWNCIMQLVRLLADQRVYALACPRHATAASASSSSSSSPGDHSNLMSARETVEQSRVIQHHVWQSAQVRLRMAERPAAVALQAETAWLDRWHHGPHSASVRQSAYELAAYALSWYLGHLHDEPEASAEDDLRSMPMLALDTAHLCFSLLIGHAAPDQQMDVAHTLVLLSRAEVAYMRSSSAAAAGESTSVADLVGLNRDGAGDSASSTTAITVSESVVQRKCTAAHFRQKSADDLSQALGKRLTVLQHAVASVFRQAVDAATEGEGRALCTQAERLVAIVDLLVVVSPGVRRSLKGPQYSLIYNWVANLLKSERQEGHTGAWKLAAPVFRALCSLALSLFAFNRQDKFPARFSLDIRRVSLNQRAELFRAVVPGTSGAAYQSLLGWLEQTMGHFEWTVDLAKQYRKARLAKELLQPAAPVLQTLSARTAIERAAKWRNQESAVSHAELAVERALTQAYLRIRPGVSILHNLMIAQLPASSRDRLMRVLQRYFKLVCAAMRERADSQVAPPVTIFRILKSIGQYLIPTVYLWLNSSAFEHQRAALRKHVEKRNKATDQDEDSANDDDDNDNDDNDGDDDDDNSSSQVNDDEDEDDLNDEDGDDWHSKNGAGQRVIGGKQKRGSQKQRRPVSVLRRSGDTFPDQAFENAAANASGEGSAAAAGGAKRRRGASTSVPSTAKVMKEARAVPALIEQMEKLELLSRKYGAKHDMQLSNLFSHHARGFEVDVEGAAHRIDEQEEEEARLDAALGLNNSCSVQSVVDEAMIDND